MNICIVHLYPFVLDDNTEYSNTVAVFQKDKNIKLTVYPNPVKDIMTIDVFDDVKTVNIYNLQGILMQESTQKTFSLSDLSSGIYILEVKFTEGGVSRIKFVKE